MESFSMKNYKTITWQEAQTLWELGVFDFEGTAGGEAWVPYSNSCDPKAYYSPEQMHLKSSMYDSYRIAVE